MDKTQAYAVTIDSSKETELQKQYPDAMRSYALLCRLKRIEAGKPVVLNNKGQSILLMPVIQNDMTDVKAVRDCLKYIQQWHNDLGIEDIVFHRFDDEHWNEVKTLINEYLKDEIPTEVSE